MFVGILGIALVGVLFFCGFRGCVRGCMLVCSLGCQHVGVNGCVADKAFHKGG